MHYTSLCQLLPNPSSFEHGCTQYPGSGQCATLAQLTSWKGKTSSIIMFLFLLSAVSLSVCFSLSVCLSSSLTIYLLQRTSPALTYVKYYLYPIPYTLFRIQIQSSLLCPLAHTMSSMTNYRLLI